MSNDTMRIVPSPHPVYRPGNGPGIAQARTATSAPPVYRPAANIHSAPPVYRPLPSPVTVQAKAAGSAAPVYRPVNNTGNAPPVYQPANVPGLQRKAAAPPPAVYRPTINANIAPPVYHPRSPAPPIQTKAAPGALRVPSVQRLPQPHIPVIQRSSEKGSGDEKSGRHGGYRG